MLQIKDSLRSHLCFESTHRFLLCSPKQMLLTIKRCGAEIIPQKVLPIPALLPLYQNMQK